MTNVVDFLALFRSLSVVLWCFVVFEQQVPVHLMILLSFSIIGCSGKVYKHKFIIHVSLDDPIMIETSNQGGKLQIIVKRKNSKT
jgi:hypothetical protein